MKGLLFILFLLTSFFSTAQNIMDTVCVLEEARRYKVSQYDPVNRVHWLINGGTITSGEYEPVVTVNWGSEPGIYNISAVAVNDLNCSSDTSEFKVLVLPIRDLKIVGSRMICKGENLRLSAQGGLDYLWNNGARSQSIIVNPDSNTLYTVISERKCGSRYAETEIPVIGIPDGIIKISTDTPLLYEEVEFAFKGYDAKEFQWSVSPEFIPEGYDEKFAKTFINKGPKTVRVRAINENGCDTIIEKNIHVSSKCDVFIPTSFSPDGDGINDVFKVESSGVGKVFIQVFNRWGEIMFTSIDPHFEWDGSYNNKNLDEGAYIIQIHAEDCNGRPLNRRETILILK